MCHYVYERCTRDDTQDAAQVERNTSLCLMRKKKLPLRAFPVNLHTDDKVHYNLCRTFNGKLYLKRTENYCKSSP